MTRDEILNMPASVALDAMIAELIFKDPKPAYEPDADRVLFTMFGTGSPPVLSDGECWQAFCFYESGDVPEWIPKPFSNHIAAAWEVVERMRRFNLFRGAGYWSCEYAGQYLERVDADTAPLAICRAALLEVLESA